MKRMVALLLLAGAALSCVAQGTLQTVFPYGYENQVGSATDFTFSNPTDRQQWFRSSYLAQTWDSPVLISGVAFRVDEAAGSMNTIIPRVEIWFTTTQRDSTDLHTFNVNAGPDARRVFATDSVALNSPGGSSPNEFGIRFSFQEPFQYDPQAGHLLMRIVTSGPVSFFAGGQITDRQGFSPLETTPMAIPQIGPNGFPSASGIVTQISWVAVPESSVASLFGLGLAFVFFTRK